MMLAPSPPKKPKAGIPTAQDARGLGGGGGVMGRGQSCMCEMLISTYKMAYSNANFGDIPDRFLKFLAWKPGTLQSKGLQRVVQD